MAVLLLGQLPSVQLAGGLCHSKRTWQRMTVPLEMVISEKFYYSKEGRCSLTEILELWRKGRAGIGYLNLLLAEIIAVMYFLAQGCTYIQE